MSEPLVPGMKTVPAFTESPLMVGAWLGCVRSMARNHEALKRFTEETGLNLNSVLLARGIEALIDKATGADVATVAAWCDWVTTNVWGEAHCINDQ